MSIDPKWTHKSRGGLDYPVAYGDVWLVADQWIVGCGDLQRAALPLLMGYAPVGPEWTYVDPPWNNGLERQFRAKAGVDPGEVDFLRLLWIVANECPTPLWVEMGHDGLNPMLTLMATLGLPRARGWPTKYGAKGANLVAFGGAPKQGPPLVAGQALTRWALDQMPHPVVDPMCGLGMTLTAAAERNVPAVGMELHPNRVSATLASLAKVTRSKPRKMKVPKLPHSGR